MRHGVDVEPRHAHSFQNFNDVDLLVESFLSIHIVFLSLVSLGLAGTFGTLAAHPLQVCEKAHALAEIVTFKALTDEVFI